MKKVSKDLNETAEIAKIFLEKILENGKNREGASVVCLSGNLGAGKTAFTQCAAKYLGVKSKVVSPTFIIFKKYQIKLVGYKFLYHIDAYRLKNEKELWSLGWEEIIADKRHLVFIEWPENVHKIIPAHADFVYIFNDKKDSRVLELK